MIDIGVLNILFDPKFLATASAAILVFATIVTFGLPFLERNTLGTRMKAVSDRREELRAKHHAALAGKRSSLRAEPVNFMKKTVDRLKLSNLMESPDTRAKLERAGLRGQAPLVAFLFFRFVMPFIVFAAALFYLFVMTNFAWTAWTKAFAAVGMALFGYYLPDLYVSNLIQKRQESIMHAFPDALDLLLICVESGMSIEAAFTRVSTEIGQQSVELAEEFALTTAELSYLPERRQAFENLARRCGHAGVKAVSAALNQAEKYGTPLGQALRVTAQENREMRMQEAERKAAALPAKLTVPMIVFFLPCLFVVILGPAIIRVMHTLH
ncbi:MAG: type II secretion system F family protein [Alphaproteobacteria bacterium]|nr:type II secretion system F family protein [Alphaproteobacteria bacterium]MBU6471861.1 type II secretion system F family protein [Alphaproteobacteria bacterium]MDE2013277.1 type II secretion system F family protein [Alphaproteobacteria bacterium]MDE2074417.1 type II secretion system F family protein [Alphaproteobacteria bacterium]MDE2350738.1 type II secretion system F family protein [Alphaproteobacteria bacterium]